MSLTEYSSLNESQLFELILSQNQQAFEELVKRHQQKVFHLALSICHNAEEAKDITQEIFLKIWERPQMWRPTASFTTFLYRITYNRTISHLRFKRIRQFLSFSSTDSPSWVEIVDPSDDPEHSLLKKESSLNLLNALRRLPYRQRWALSLRYFEKLTLMQIAAIMNSSPKSVEGLIYRALKRLKSLLAL